MKLLIAIPALNEEQSIRSTIQRCLEAEPAILQNSPVTSIEVTVVSDGSTDRTVERAREFGSLINLIEFTKNQGYGAAIMEAYTDDDRRESMKQSANIFRVLIKTLLNAGIITDRTRAFYAMYVDMDGLKSEGGRMVGDEIAEQGIQYLQSINFTGKGRELLAAE